MGKTHVVCGACQAAYDVDQARIPSAGLKMRCTNCGAQVLVPASGVAQAAASNAPKDDLPAVRPEGGAAILGTPRARRSSSAPTRIYSATSGERKDATPLSFLRPDAKARSSALNDEANLPQPVAKPTGNTRTFGSGTADPNGALASSSTSGDLPRPKGRLGSAQVALPRPKGAPSRDVDQLPRAKGAPAPDADQLPRAKGASAEPHVAPSAPSEGSSHGQDLPQAKARGETDPALPRVAGTNAAAEPAGLPQAAEKRRGTADLPAPAGQVKAAPPPVPDLPVARNGQRLATPLVGLPGVASRKPTTQDAEPIELSDDAVELTDDDVQQLDAAPNDSAPGSSTQYDQDARMTSVGVPQRTDSNPAADASTQIFSDGSAADSAGEDADADFGKIDLGNIDLDDLRWVESTSSAQAGDAPALDASGATSNATSASATPSGAHAVDNLVGGSQSSGVSSSEVADAKAPTTDARKQPRLRRTARAQLSSAERKRLRIRLAVGVATLLVTIGGAGASLGLTEYGPFGWHVVEQHLPSAGSPARARAAIEAAEKRGRDDTYAGLRGSLKELARARHAMGLNRQLLTRSVVHEALFQIRFGIDSASTSRLAAIQARIRERRWHGVDVDLANAAEAVRTGKYPHAQAVLARLQQQTPKDAYVHLLMGELALLQGAQHASAAEAAFKNASEAGAGARALWGSARAARAAGTFEKAQEYLRELLENSPQHAEARVGLAQLQIKGGALDEAVATLQPLTGNAPNGGSARPAEPVPTMARATHASVWRTIGDAQRLSRRFDAAARSYSAAIDIDSNDIEALSGLGEVLLELGSHAEALTRFETIAGWDPTGAAVLDNGWTSHEVADFGKARCLLGLGRIAQARDLIQKTIAKHGDDPAVLLWAGHIERADSQGAKAQALYLQVIEREPLKLPGYLALARLNFLMERPTDGVRILGEAEQKVAKNAQALTEIGHVFLEHADLTRARAYFDRALQAEPNYNPALFALGVTLRRSGDLGAAEAKFRQLEARDSNFAGLAMELGIIHESRGDWPATAENYRRALKRAPDDASLLLRLATAEIEAGQIDVGEKTLKLAIPKNPNSPQVEFLLGRILYTRNDLPTAYARFSRARALNPNYAQYQYYAGLVALKLNNFAQAREAADHAVQLDARHAGAHALRGTVLLNMGQAREAIQELTLADKLEANNANTLAALAEAYDRVSDFKRAVEAFERALSIAPNHPFWWYRVGQIHIGQGAMAPTVRAMEQAIKTSKDESPAPVWLGDAYKSLGDGYRGLEKHESAIAEYRNYLKLSRRNSAEREEIEAYIRKQGVNPY